MADTKIEWTNGVWNPVTGCSKVSQGCKNCYAEGIAKRFFATGYPPNDDGSLRTFTDVRCHEDRLDIPLRWKKTRRIFVNSMSDLFHPDVPFGFISKVFAVMGLCSQHTFQVLTKRPERMLEYVLQAKHRSPGFTEASVCMAHKVQGLTADQIASLQFTAGNTWPLPNVWLGVSVEDQKTADERIPLLLQTPAAVRWVSAEPLLGPIEFRGSWLNPTAQPANPLGWVVVGGESGPGARPMHPDWARSLRDQCQAANVPFFFKQWGEWKQSDNPVESFNHNTGDFETITARVAFKRVGKHTAGRLLDGREWNEYPEAKQKGGE